MPYDAANRALFLYGTLMPRHGAWELVAPSAAGEPEPATASGVLFDTGRGYPAACFDARAATAIRGVVVRLVAEHSHATLRRLDRYEGPEYRRITVTTSAGPAEAYDWIGPRTDLAAIASGAWSQPGGTPPER